MRQAVLLFYRRPRPRPLSPDASVYPVKDAENPCETPVLPLRNRFAQAIDSLEYFVFLTISLTDTKRRFL